MKEAVIFVADTHINSKVGLCLPEVLEDDGDTYKANLIQEWLWYTWNKCIKDIKKIVKKRYTTVILNGDVADLDSKKRTNQMVSRNPNTILRLARETLEPLTELADRVFVIRGTEAHVGKSGWIEEMLAESIGAEKNKDLGQWSWWHLRAKFSDVKFDIAHHTSMGNLPYTYPNSLTRLIQVTKLNYLDWGESLPDVIVRAHNHRHVDTGTTFSTRGVGLPGWQFPGNYLYRLGKENDRPHIGASVFICDKGEHEYKPLIYEPQRSEAWERT